MAILSPIIFRPEPVKKRGKRILPVFLPFAGCPRRCVFCAQDVQTGVGTAVWQATLDHVDEQLRLLAARCDAPVELAFYGGTFTALPRAVQDACLALAARHAQAGVVAGVRCSTRPDCVSPGVLQRLGEAGVTTVELGVQSFDDAVLALAGRGMDAATVRQGCAQVNEAGLALGIQLLPGLPGATVQGFVADVAEALTLSPACLRFYPCLVLEGTELAAWWREGRYAPWQVAATVDALAQGLLMAWDADVPVIRLGVAPGDELQAALLAGPWHPALGSMVRGRALWLAVARQVGRLPRGGAQSLAVPRRYRGELWGHRGALREAWASLGLGHENVYWHDGEDWLLQ